MDLNASQLEVSALHLLPSSSAAAWSALRPACIMVTEADNYRPLEIKKIVDEARAHLDLDPELTVADVWLDKGLAKTNGRDQSGSVRVILKPAFNPPARFSSVDLDWEGAARAYPGYLGIQATSVSQNLAPIPEEPSSSPSNGVSGNGRSEGHTVDSALPEAPKSDLVSSIESKDSSAESSSDSDDETSPAPEVPSDGGRMLSPELGSELAPVAFGRQNHRSSPDSEAKVDDENETGSEAHKDSAVDSDETSSSGSSSEESDSEESESESAGEESASQAESSDPSWSDTSSDSSEYDESRGHELLPFHCFTHSNKENQSSGQTGTVRIPVSSPIANPHNLTLFKAPTNGNSVKEAPKSNHPSKSTNDSEQASKKSDLSLVSNGANSGKKRENEQPTPEKPGAGKNKRPKKAKATSPTPTAHQPSRPETFDERFSRIEKEVEETRKRRAQTRLDYERKIAFAAVEHPESEYLWALRATYKQWELVQRREDSGRKREMDALPKSREKLAEQHAKLAYLEKQLGIMDGADVKFEHLPSSGAAKTAAPSQAQHAKGTSIASSEPGVPFQVSAPAESGSVTAGNDVNCASDTTTAVSPGTCASSSSNVQVVVPFPAKNSCPEAPSNAGPSPKSNQVRQNSSSKNIPFNVASNAGPSPLTKSGGATQTSPANRDSIGTQAIASSPSAGREITYGRATAPTALSTDAVDTDPAPKRKYSRHYALQRAIDGRSPDSANESSLSPETAALEREIVRSLVRDGDLEPVDWNVELNSDVEVGNEYDWREASAAPTPRMRTPAARSSTGPFSSTTSRKRKFGPEEQTQATSGGAPSAKRPRATRNRGRGGGQRLNWPRISDIFDR